MHELWLSIGKHRRETNWKNKKFTWTELLQKLSNTQRTGETVKEYASLDRDQQDQIKDIGGFVGGIITGGKRKKTAVSSRSIISLDLDHGSTDFWETITLIFGCALCVYSTHKHTPESPRLRLIIPLSEEVLPDQYQAIARKIAEAVGMEMFDPTTFQPERLMYWPSTPKDGVYLFEQQEGSFMDPLKVLAKYKDWTDSSQWPMHPREAERVHEGVTQAQDPTEKTGVVGAFCRVYGITEVIEAYLQDVYEPAQEGRYTYKHGSTAGGLVVYGDKWAYSHHGTDPVSGHLCNSFDLVRLHKYGRLDSRVKEDTPINKRPSFIAMAEFARKDGAVNLDLVKQQTGRAMQAFAGELEQGDADAWLKSLETDKRDKIVGTSENILIIFRNDPNLKDKLALNAFSCQYRVLGSLPWKDTEIEREWTDNDDAGLRWYVETTYKITAVNKLYDCVSMVMQENSFHPVREYLESLQWDGTERLSRLLIDYLGAEDSEYTRAVTYKTFVGAVARVMRPGIKFDTVLTLIGPQGSAKSELISVMGGEWYSENLGKLDTNQAMENIQGAWLTEIAEMAALKKAEVEVIKHFISKRKDEFRPAFGRRKQSFPRQNIFIGSANDDDFIKDQTGGRRFWPSQIIKSLFYKNRVFNVLPKFRDQLWAEALQGYLNDEPLHLPADIEQIAEGVQAAHTEKDMWSEIIYTYLETPLPENWQEMGLYNRIAYLKGDETQPKGVISREKVTAYEIWIECLGGDNRSITGATGRRISGIMKKLGWNMSNKQERLKVGIHFPAGRKNYYFRNGIDDLDGL